jgi:hypothetical protein
VGVLVLVFRVSDGGLERKLVLVFLFLFSCCLRWLLARTSRADTYEPSMRHGRRDATKDQASQSAISFSLVLNNPRISTNKSSHTRASYSPSPYSSCHQVNINNLLMLVDVDIAIDIERPPVYSHNLDFRHRRPRCGEMSHPGFGACHTPTPTKSNLKPNPTQPSKGELTLPPPHSTTY